MSFIEPDKLKNLRKPELKKYIDLLKKDEKQFREEFAVRTLAIEKSRAAELNALDEQQDKRMKKLKFAEQQDIKSMRDQAAQRRRETDERNLKEVKEMEEERKAKMDEGAKWILSAQQQNITARNDQFREKMQINQQLDELLTSHGKEIKEMKEVQYQMEEENKRHMINHTNVLTNIKMANVQTEELMISAKMKRELNRMNQQLMDNITNEISVIVDKYQMVRAKVEHAIRTSSVDVLIRFERVIEQLINQIKTKLTLVKSHLECFKDREIDELNEERQRVCIDLLSILTHLNGDCEALTSSIDSKGTIDIGIVSINLEHLHNNIDAMRHLKAALPHIKRAKPMEDIFKERSDMLMDHDFKTSAGGNTLKMEDDSMENNMKYEETIV